MIAVTVLHEGDAEGPLLVLDEPLSFWGGFDPQTGRVVDQHHPQAGALAGGTVLALPETRGSAGTPAGVAEAIRKGCGPVAIITAKKDVNLVAGVMTARQLYDICVPVVEVAQDELSKLTTGQTARLSGGNLTILP
ncbi:MAG: DUF126 domain-containing protein [Alphaproteobacteria bacterium]|nr:DUF126 domain-containing protein [Alphaproteobacteria bacterium]